MASIVVVKQQSGGETENKERKKLNVKIFIMGFFFNIPAMPQAYLFFYWFHCCKSTIYRQYVKAVINCNFA
jgi:hypothetical protein